MVFKRVYNVFIILQPTSTYAKHLDKFHQDHRPSTIRTTVQKRTTLGSRSGRFGGLRRGVFHQRKQKGGVTWRQPLAACLICTDVSFRLEETSLAHLNAPKHLEKYYSKSQGGLLTMGWLWSVWSVQNYSSKILGRTTLGSRFGRRGGVRRGVLIRGN